MLPREIVRQMLSSGSPSRPPLRSSDISRALAAYESVAHSRRGETIFLAGGQESGRTALLADLGQALQRLKPPPIVVAGSCTTGRYEPWDNARERAGSRKALTLLKRVISATAPFHPVAGVAQQIMTSSSAAWQVVAELASEGVTEEPFRLVPRLLRRAASVGPVVCLVDDADLAEGDWWFDLVHLFAQQVAAELPLLLVMALEGPQVLGPHEEGEPETLFVARRLRERHVAQWWALQALERDEIASWIGHASPDVAEHLHRITGGQAGWVTRLWADWQERGAVEQNEGYWTFAPGDRSLALGPVSDLLSSRLNRALNSSDARVGGPVMDLLADAALEGPCFTADALARMSGRNTEEVIDCLDNVLGVNERTPYGFVRRARDLTIDDESGERDLHLYRFVDKLDWLALRHYGLREGELAGRALALAEVLEQLYGSERHRVARTLARLFADAGNEARGRIYKGMADLGTSHDVLCWRARQLIEGSEEKRSDEWDRRQSSEVLLAAAASLFYSGPFREGLRFAVGAYKRADARRTKARALYLRGSFRARLGEYRQSRGDLAMAVEAWHSLGEKDREAEASSVLAGIYGIERDFRKASEGFTRTLELWQAAGNKGGEAYAVHHLAWIDHERGRLREAREGFGQALEMRRELGGVRDEASSLHALARLDHAEGFYIRAREVLLEVLDVWRELHDLNHEAQVRHDLAMVDIEEGQLDRAREEFLRLVKLTTRVGDPRGKAAAHANLAWIAQKRGDHCEARLELAQEAALWRRLGVMEHESDARDALAKLYVQDGNLKDGAAELRRLIDLFRRLENGEREAEVRWALDSIAPSGKRDGPDTRSWSSGQRSTSTGARRPRGGT